MKYLFTLILFFTLNHNYGQDASTYPGQFTTDFISLDIHNDHVIAIGGCQGIWTSRNSGANWDVEYFAYLGQHNIQVFPNNPSRALIQIEGLLSLYDMDDGIVESYTDLGSNLQIRNIEILEDKVFLYASEGIYSSDIDNVEWQLIVDVDTDTHGSLGKMDVTDVYIYFTTNQGKLFKYNRSNNSTVELMQFGSRIDELSMGNDEHGVISVSSESKPFRTTDGWSTYVSLDGFSYGRNIVAHGELYIMTALGPQLEISTDGGENVDQKFLGDLSFMGEVRRAFFKDDASIYVYGSGACLAQSTNDGDDWSYANPYNREEVKYIDINASGIGYAGSSLTSLVKTEDHGVNWSSYEINSNIEGFVVGVAALDNGNLVLTTTIAIYAIEDGVASQSEEYTGVSLFRDQNDQYLLCQVFSDGKYQIIRSEDRGLSWSASLDLPQIAYDINQDENGYLYLATNAGASYHKSEDNGLTWDLLDIDHSANSFTVINGVYYSNDFSNLYRSEDEGSTWENVMQFSFGVVAPKVGPDQALYTISGGDDTALHRSEDNGETWERIWTFCAKPHRFVVNDLDQLVISHYDGHINVYPRPIMSNVFQEEVNNNLPVVYPNPVSAGSEIHIKGKVKSGALLNLDGRIIREYQQELESIQLPIELSAGTYILRLEMNHTTYHKLIIIN